MTDYAIFAIGNELLEGSIIDTNSSFISSNLVDYGLNCKEIRLLPDNITVLKNEFEKAMQNYNFILTTGGLGPTFDDITAEAISKATERELAFHNDVFKHISSMLKNKNVSLKTSHRKQAYLPAGCRIFPNSVGTAPAFAVETENSCIISLPGIPYEMKPLFEQQVLPFIKDSFQLQRRFHKDLRFAGIPESDVDETIKKNKPSKHLEIIINVSHGETIIRLRSFKQKLVEDFSKILQESLAHFFIGFKKDSIASAIVKLFKERNETLSIAESCTGGFIGKEITNIPGSSSVFKGGIIVYSNQSKIDLLGVPTEILNDYGAVSQQCAEYLVRNTQKLFGTTAAISVTGIAGPTGGTNEKPVGTVFIGLRYKKREEILKYLFPGDRESIRKRTVKIAISGLIRLARK